MATQLCLSGFGVTEAERAYELRSHLAHGQKLDQLNDSDRTLYGTMETVLRTAVLRVAEEKSFASIFGGDDVIRRHWPL
jgi:hypothetical protein